LHKSIIVIVTTTGGIMADITRYPFVRHLRGGATTYVSHLRNGRTVHAGVGTAFWFRPLSAVLSEVPVDDRELPLMFHARSVDFQDVAVQSTLTYRLTDPELVRQRIDFSIDPATGQWRSTPLDQVAGLLTETAQQYALDVVASLSLTEALVDGFARIREAVSHGVGQDERLAATGITVVAVRVVGIRPEPELEKALQTPAREEAQQVADRATFERRAVAVERERAIGENELQTQIELARREEHLVEQRGANMRREAEETAKAGEIATEAEAQRVQRLAEAAAQAKRVEGAAAGEAERAFVGAYADLSEAVLMGLALKELAANLPRIDSLVLTPDLLTPVLAKLGSGAGERGDRS
jgi:regulator of protease activity HflC (stomatin/prohibitin superfamily)